MSVGGGLLAEGGEREGLQVEGKQLLGEGLLLVGLLIVGRDLYHVVAASKQTFYQLLVIDQLRRFDRRLGTPGTFGLLQSLRLGLNLLSQNLSKLMPLFQPLILLLNRLLSLLLIDSILHLQVQRCNHKVVQVLALIIFCGA